MPRLSLFGKKSCLAVDVGTSAVKVCRLAGGGGKYKLEMWDSLPMPVGLSGKDFETKATEQLKEIVDKHRLRKQPAIFALPSQAVVIRYLTFQGIPRERLEGVVRHEAEGHIPFPLAEVSLDWCEARKKENGFEVLLAAIKQDKLDSMVSIIEDAGLGVQIVDITTLALFSLYYHCALKEEKETEISEVFVDIGSGTTDIAFLKNQRVFFTRSVPIAGRSFTEIISKRLGVPEDKAEQLKVKHAEVKAIVTELTALEGATKPGSLGGLGAPKAPGAGLPSGKAPGLAAPKAPGLAGPAASGGLAPPKAPGLTPPAPAAPSPVAPSAGGLAPPKAPGLTPPAAGGLTPPPRPAPPGAVPKSAVGAGEADQKEIPKKITEVPLPKPPTLPPMPIAPPGAGYAPRISAPGAPSVGVSDSGPPPVAPGTPTVSPAAPPPGLGAPKPPALSLPKPSAGSASLTPQVPASPTPAAPAPGTHATSPAAPPPPGLGAPKLPAISLPKPPAGSAPPGLGAPKPPALSLPKPPAGSAPPAPQVPASPTPAAPAPGTHAASPAAPPPPGLGAPKPPALSLPKPPPGIPPAPPGGKSLGAAKAEDGEVFSLFESGDETVDKEKLSSAVKPIADRLATELRRSFDYFVGQLSGGEIKRVTLSGGGASLKGLAEYLSAQLSVPVRVFDPMKNIHSPQISRGDDINAQAFSVALGMGMRVLDGSPLDIDMLPENIVAMRRLRSMGADLRKLGVAACILIGLVGMYLYMTVRNTEILHTKIKSDIQELEPVVSRTRQLEKDQKTVNDLEKSIAGLISSKAGWTEVLSALDKTMPDNANIAQLAMPNKERLELRLVTSSLTEIPEIGKRFQSADLTKNFFFLTNRPNPREALSQTGVKTFEVDFVLKVDHSAVQSTRSGAQASPGT